VRREGNAAPNSRPPSAPMTPSVKADRSEGVSGRSKMGPPLGKPAKPTSDEDSVEACTPCPNTANHQTTQLPTPLTSSKDQPQQADAGSTIVVGDDSDDEAGNEASGETQATTGGDEEDEDFGNADWLDVYLSDGNDPNESASPARGNSVPATKPAQKSRSVFGALAAQAEATRITPAVRALLIKDIQGASHEGASLGHVVGPILDFVLEGARSNNLPETEYYFNIVPEWKLSLDDILSLWFMQGQENAAWFTDALMHSLLEVDAKNVKDVFIDCHLDHFLIEDYSDNLLEADIDAAKRGRDPSLGWPLVDMRKEHTRILATVNPTKAHWVTVELTLGTKTQPAKLQLYNSLRSTSGKGGTVRMITRTLPQILYLASLRPGSPLAGFDPYGLELEEVNCPQQAGSFDCGPLSLWFAARRLYKRPAWKDLPTDAHQHRFGRWIREESARIILNRISGGLEFSFKSLFDKDDEVEELERMAAEGEEWDRLAEEAQLAQYLADNGLDDTSSSPTNGGPALPDGADHANEAAGGEPGIDGDEGDDADLHETSQMIRLEFGERNDRYPSIIVVLRWSSDAPWWRKSTEDEVVETILLDLAMPRVQSYLAAAGLPANGVHVIIHAAANIRTRYMPVLHISQNEPPAVVSQNKLPEVTDGFSVSCPFCDWTSTHKDFHKLLDGVNRHYPTHHPHFSATVIAGQLQPDGKEWSYTCREDDCDKKIKSKRKAAIYASARVHWAVKHGSVWLDEQEKSLQIRCHCEDCTSDGNGIWINLDDLRTHAKGAHVCLFCSKSTSFSSSKARNGHMSVHHWDETTPAGWHRCDLVAVDRSNCPWSAMSAVLKRRLLWVSGRKCVWALNDANCCETSREFRSDRQLEKHYDLAHANENWPESSANELACGSLIPEGGNVDRHLYLVHPETYHAKGKPSSREQADQKRAQLFTNAITTDLRSLSDGVIPAVLLSVGLDGFTCNTSLLQPWLKEIDLDFELAIWTGHIPAMSEQHFAQVDTAYVGRYDSRELMRCLEDRTQAPEAYINLINVWEDQQRHKEEHKRLYAPRNSRAA
jgi:hypothetical protein